VASATFEEAIRLHAADFSSFTSTSPQDVQAKNSKSEWPSGFGTLRTSFMMPPQAWQRSIAKLLAKFMMQPQDDRVVQ
jgi:hypothetical protein